MSDVRFLTYPVFQAFDDNGNPLSGGKVNVYSEGTTDRIDTWTDATQNTKNANPVILNSRGEADIWFDAPAKIVLTDSADVTVKTIDSVSPLNAQTITGKYNLLENGSFELDGDGDGKPDSWDIVETDGSSTVEIDTSTVAHGSNSLKFVSGSGGGGTATTSEKFPVKDGKDIGVSFFVASTTTTATNKVDLIFYDSSGTNPSTSNVYTSGGTSPSTLTEKSFSVSVPSGKTQAEVKLTGVDNTETATTYFDFVQVKDDQLGGYKFTGTAGEVTASAAELNKTDGLTATTAELNTAVSVAYRDSVDLTNGGSNDLTQYDIENIPSNAFRITLFFDEFSFDDSASGDELLFLLGDSGGFETSGYRSMTNSDGFGSGTYSADSDGFHVGNTPLAAVNYSGTVTFNLMDSSNNTWISEHLLVSHGATNTRGGGGIKSLSGTLDSIRVTGTVPEEFDSGSLVVRIETTPS